MGERGRCVFKAVKVVLDTHSRGIGVWSNAFSLEKSITNHSLNAYEISGLGKQSKSYDD